jgi:hypothetical protein
VTFSAGLISDTHLPQRLRALPATVADVFEGVDLLLHAGDVGELRVLEALSAIAPVVAVHGNDDTVEAQRELPAQQLVSIAGRRLLLWHSHHPDRETELRLRQDDAWAPKLARIRERARRAGATIAVFGHMHVPLQQHEDGILLVNPGALASGNPYTRQRLQTVALLFLHADGAVTVRHVDLSAPNRPFVAQVTWSHGFSRALSAVSDTILSPDLEPLAALLKGRRLTAGPALEAAYYRLAHRCWAGDTRLITQADYLHEISADPAVDPADRAILRTLLSP